MLATAYKIADSRVGNRMEIRQGKTGPEQISVYSHIPDVLQPAQIDASEV